MSGTVPVKIAVSDIWRETDGGLLLAMASVEVDVGGVRIELGGIRLLRGQRGGPPGVKLPRIPSSVRGWRRTVTLPPEVWVIVQREVLAVAEERGIL